MGFARTASPRSARQGRSAPTIPPTLSYVRSPNRIPALATTSPRVFAIRTKLSGKHLCRVGGGACPILGTHKAQPPLPPPGTGASFSASCYGRSRDISQSTPWFDSKISAASRTPRRPKSTHGCEGRRSRLPVRAKQSTTHERSPA